MKSAFLILLCSLLAFAGRADWVVVKRVESGSQMMHQTNDITLKIKGNKVRIDTRQDTSIIMDNDSGDQTVLMHPPKTYMVQSASQLKEMKELIKGRDGAVKESLQLHSTGKKEKINGYETEEFACDGADWAGRYWITKDIPNYVALRDALETGFAETRKMSTRPLPDTKTLPGYPVRSEQTSVQRIDSGKVQWFTNVTTTTLLSVREEILGDSEFTIPADYTKAGAKPVSRSPNTNGGLREVLKAMEKQGLSEADRKKYEQIVKDAEAEQAKKRKQ